MQGFNMGRYVPPDLEGTTSGNKLNKKHPLGNRASKLASQGILTVRFEMPFPVWCARCPKPTIIGQGVRFNAEKRRAGSYYTTPVWSFRFRHAECGGWIEMRTDPKNTAYVVIEGGTKRNIGDDDGGGGGGGDLGGAILTDRERDELRKNAFASLEKTIADRKQLEMAAERIDDLEDLSRRCWDDPYTHNQRLRKAFRAGRKEREKAAAATEELADRMGLAMDLLPEMEEDALRASLVDFGPRSDGERWEDKALSKPLFASTASRSKTRQKSSSAARDAGIKAKREASRRKESFVADVISNTRAAHDPFLMRPGRKDNKATTSRSSLGIVKKRKRLDDVPETKDGVSTGGLVLYDSD